MFFFVGVGYCTFQTNPIVCSEGGFVIELGGPSWDVSKLSQLKGKMVKME